MRTAMMAVAVMALGACDGGHEQRTIAEVPVTAAADIAVPPAVTAALDDPARAKAKADDERRQAAAIVALSGVKAGDKVYELIPGAGYWTQIFSKVVGPEGRVHAVWPEQYARYSRANVSGLETLAKTPDFANVRVAVLPTPALSAPESVDLFFTSQNYHDYPAEFMGNHDPKLLNDAVFKMLKPGGTYMVVDHAAAPGTTLAETRELHRIDPELVKRQVIDAGFELVAETDALRKPGDQYALKVFDPQVRGKTDKFVLKFRKPAS